jgi:hypothetical protein
VQDFAFTTLCNLTPHQLNFVGPDNNTYMTLDPDPRGAARCDVTRRTVGEAVIDQQTSVPINSIAYGDVYGLPDPADNTLYVVSLPVAQALRNLRDDIMVVDELCRDTAGRIIGARALSRLSEIKEPSQYIVTEIWRQRVGSPSIWQGRERGGRNVTICYGLGEVNVYCADATVEDIFETAPVLTLQHGDETDGYISYPDLRRLLSGQVALPPRFTSAAMAGNNGR